MRLSVLICSAEVISTKTKDIILDLRSKRGLSQDELAEKVFVTRQAVSRWETGETVPSVYQFLAVCSALDMDDRLSSYKNDFVPELNEEGLRKVEQYKHDLVCSGNYKPAQKILQFIKYIEMPVADLPAAAGTGARTCAGTCTGTGAVGTGTVA